MFSALHTYRNSFSVSVFFLFACCRSSLFRLYVATQSRPPNRQLVSLSANSRVCKYCACVCWCVCVCVASADKILTVQLCGKLCLYYYCSTALPRPYSYCRQFEASRQPDRALMVMMIYAFGVRGTRLSEYASKIVKLSFVYTRTSWDKKRVDRAVFFWVWVGVFAVCVFVVLLKFSWILFWVSIIVYPENEFRDLINGLW